VFGQVVLVTLACAVLGQASGAPSPTPQSAASATPSAGGKARPHEDFAGTWKYNADDSVNAATGRSETARAVNDRRGVRSGGVGPRRGGPGGIGSSGGGPGGGGSSGGGGFGPDPGMSLYLEQRDAQRDLMEIALELKLVVTTTAVSVTDDLDRTLTYPTDGKKQKYQLGAAVFDAKTYWDGGQLRNDIEGPLGLKITATYFLSEGGDRLFLILRVGDPVKDAPPVGVNRVYDRVK
jgi:hypothetical protein